jgi:serine/threonine protein kinase
MHGQVKILDFGLAKLTVGAGLVPALTGRPQEVPLEELPTASIDQDALSSPGLLIGTVAYMSPEQARGEDVDTRTDLFSFGAVLYEMATGRQAFQGSTTAVIFTAILTQAPPSPLELNRDLPTKLEGIINKALEKDRDLRYQHASDIRKDLKRVQHDTDSQPSAGALLRLAAKRWKLTAAAVLLLVGLALGGYFYYHRAPALTERDTIVLADFTNTTGDPVFDGALRQGLAVQLEQSPFLS